MADWYKTYNDGLDSKGMQYAISQQPLAVGVWQALLSEASKARSGKLKWSEQGFEIVGLSRKLNIQVEAFKQSLDLLAHVEYITIEGGYLIIHGWERMQSTYARGVDKGYYTETTKKKPISSSLVSQPNAASVVSDPPNEISPTNHAWNPAIQILTYLNAATKSSFRPVPVNLKAIKLRLDEVQGDIAGVKQMIDRQVASWLNVAEMRKYLRPETLFGATKFHGYYGAKDLPPETRTAIAAPRISLRDVEAKLNRHVCNPESMHYWRSQPNPVEPSADVVADYKRLRELREQLT